MYHQPGGMQYPHPPDFLLPCLLELTLCKGVNCLGLGYGDPSKLGGVRDRVVVIPPTFLRALLVSQPQREIHKPHSPNS